MKATRVGLWSIWLYGLILILLSVYFIQTIPFRDEFERPSSIVTRFDNSGDLPNPKVTIFSSPGPFFGKRQSLAIQSWLSLSPQITVVLFTQNPFPASFASSRVLIDSNVDFTFVGTPFFHSMVERSRTYETDICVFVNPETVILSGFISTLNYAYKLDVDWLLIAALRNVSYFPFRFDDSGKYWLKADGKRIKLQEMILDQNWQWNNCDDKMLMAWNSKNVALFNGIIPPFLFEKGIHNHWLVNEAVLSELRFVFDASWTITCLYLNDYEERYNSSGFSSTSNGSWENVGNTHLGASYGSLFFQETNYSSLIKLVNCDGKYLFVNTTKDVTYPYIDQKLSVWSRRILRSRAKKKTIAACVNNIKSRERTPNCSFQNHLKYLAPLDNKFSLESLLLATADVNKTVVLGVAGYSYKDMLMSWVCRLRHLHVTNFLVCALDQETYEFSLLQGLPVFYDPTAPHNISFNDCHFGTTCFQRVTKVKSRTVLKILKLGFNVLLSDVDVYWFSNPMPTLSAFGPAVLLAQSDEYKSGPVNLPRRLNSGFYFARSDISTIAAMEKVVNHAANSSLSEQPSFYDTLCGIGGSNRIGDDTCLEPETNLTVQFLDRNLFPNGAYLDIWQEKNVKRACKKIGCLVLHNNWISGRAKKLERQVSSGLWEYDNARRMCCKECAFLDFLDTSIEIAMLKACVNSLCQNQGSHKESEGKESSRGVPSSLNFSSQSRDFSVRIVHAGGREEFYQYTVPASYLMEKYPGMRVARPEVFRNPQKALLRPDEDLLIGQKYLMIPSTTAQKLKHKHEERLKASAAASGGNEATDVNITWDPSLDISNESVSSAKDFYNTKGNSSRGSKSSVRRNLKSKKAFVPPLPKTRVFRSTGWEPSLTSVQELSP